MNHLKKLVPHRFIFKDSSWLYIWHVICSICVICFFTATHSVCPLAQSYMSLLVKVTLHIFFWTSLFLLTWFQVILWRMLLLFLLLFELLNVGLNKFDAVILILLLILCIGSLWVTFIFSLLINLCMSLWLMML